MYLNKQLKENKKTNSEIGINSREGVQLKGERIKKDTEKFKERQRIPYRVQKSLKV